MDQADVETYLRCRAEDALMSQAGVSDVVRRVQAAIAIGAVEESVARAVLADFRRVWAIRTGDMHDEYVEEQPAEPGRTIACPTAIDQPWGTVLITHASLGEHETTLGVVGWFTAAPSTATPSPAPNRRTRFRPHDWPDSLDVVDDRGHTHDSHFHGGSSDRDFEGGYSVRPPLDPTTGSITVLGQRVDLTGSAPAPAVRIESIEGWSPADRARRHLDRLGSERHRPWNDGGLDVVIQTLADLGVADVDPPGEQADDPAQVQRRMRRRAALSSPSSSPQWIVIGAVIGPVDGLTLSVPVLRRNGDAVTISYSYVGDTHEEPDQQVRATATDDLGHSYRFEMRGGSGGGGSWSASAELEPALDPAATTLTVEFHTLTHIAHVTVPLDWQER